MNDSTMREILDMMRMVFAIIARRPSVFLWNMLFVESPLDGGQLEGPCGFRDAFA